MRTLLLLLALASCTATPAVRTGTGGAASPRAAVLYRDTVTVSMTDGTLCAGVRPGGTGAWSTTLSGCPHGWPVEVRRPTALPRLPLAMGEAGDPWVVLSPPGRPPLGFAPATGGA